MQEEEGVRVEPAAACFRALRRFHCHVPGVHAVHLAYLPSQQQPHSQGAAAAGEPGCSPLLVLRDNRQYSIAAPPGARLQAVVAALG
jgi:hypothetical protein